MLPTRLPKLKLLRQQCDAYLDIAHCVRDHTIAQYEAYLAQPATGPAFNKREWKLLKRKEHFRIYASRETQLASAYPTTNPPRRGSAIHHSAEWQPQTKLQCVGSYNGSLDDAMYGGVTPTEKAMMVRSLGIQDQFVDHKTLCDITIPTEDDPFTYAGLKWSARPPYLATMVKPRDLTYVQSTGFCEINNNGNIERVGYFVYHSVDIPEVPELTEQGFRRCRFSMSVLKRPTSAGTIEVFATVASDAGGDLPRELTTLFSANALLGIHKAMDNALKKKLVWLRAAKSHARMGVQHDSDMASLRQRDSVLKVPSTVNVCRQCVRYLFALRTLRLCHVCESRVCARCLSPQTLVLGATTSQLTCVDVPTCHGCIVEASQMDARELAINEFVKPFQASPRRQVSQIREMRSRTLSTDSTWTVASSRPDWTTELPTDLSEGETSTGPPGLLRSVSNASVRPQVPSANLRFRYFRVARWPPGHLPEAARAVTEPMAGDESRLWTQMNHLRAQVEATYWMTTHQSHAVLHMNTSSTRPLDQPTRPRRQTSV